MHTALAHAEARPHASAGSGIVFREPGPPTTALASRNSLSDRPTCRIYPVESSWILQLDRSSAWVVGALGPGVYRSFLTLAAAVRFADRYGLDYRIVRRKPFLITNARRKLRRSQDRHCS